MKKRRTVGEMCDTISGIESARAAKQFLLEYLTSTPLNIIQSNVVWARGNGVNELACNEILRQIKELES